MPLSSTSEPYSEIAAGERECSAGRDRRDQRGQHETAQDRHPAGAQRRRRLLDVRVELGEHRLDGPDDERQGHEGERERDRGRVFETLMPSGLFGP